MSGFAVGDPPSPGTGFVTIQTPAGTSPVADSVSDTLTITSDGKVTATGNSTTDTIALSIVAGSLVNADVNASAAIAYSKLAALTSAYILVGNGSNVATAVAPSGAFTITNAGVSTLSALNVTNAAVSGTPGTASQINTGDPNTIGLIVKGNTYNPTAANPDTITGLDVWLKADSLALSDGDPVSTWTDSGSGGYNATQSGAARPTYKTSILNSLPVVRFAGSQSLTNATLPARGSGDFTMFVVTRPSSSAATKVFAMYGSNAGGGWYFYHDSVKVAIGQIGFASTLVTTAPTISQSVFNILDIQKSGSTFTPLVDGAATTAANGTSAGTSTGLGYYLGDTQATGFSWSGDIAEYISYNVALSAANIAKIQSYLSLKYGITTSSAVAQISDLQEWQSSAGTVLASVSAAGNILTPAVTISGQTASKAAYFDASKVLTSSATTTTELGYVSGVTSAIQTQINTKLASAWQLYGISAGQTSTSNAAANITSIAFAVGASETWTYEVHLFGGCSTTNGVKFATTFPTGGVLKAEITGVNTGSTTFRTENMSATSGTLTSTVQWAIVSTAVNSRIFGIFVNSTNAGTVQIQFASATDTDTSTISANTYILARRLV